MVDFDQRVEENKVHSVKIWDGQAIFPAQKNSQCKKP